MMRLLLAATALTLAAPCAARDFDPLAFFTGATRGTATLKVTLRPTVAVIVESRGRPDGKGGLILDQTIREGDKPPRDRRWVLRRTSPTTLTGTVTDNPGPVKGWIADGKLHLRYMMKGGMKVEQLLTPQPGGRSVVNRMTVRKLGIVVARLDEVIRKTD